MGLLDRLLGRNRREGYASPAPEHQAPPSGQVPPAPAGTTEDQRAIERYRYLLRTAPPDQIEEAHAEAFARLTPEQRQEVLGQLAATGERPQGDDARSLARAATRAEVRSPGTLERAFGGGYGGGGYGGGGYGGGPGYGRGYGGPGFGSMVGGSMLGTIGGLVIGTAVADALFDTGMGDSGLFGGEDEMAAADGGDGFGGEDAGYGADGDYGAGGDVGGVDYGAGDVGGGDFGGGDFGGGDFGGGDF